ncbi:nuclear transport factor 2 family protein [Sphingobium sp. AN641]|uniref:nuclear transport factor 2 family protein n=1 Tax=Sphingobium sp. AN641 TaxID=3133443 RepID=UPI0030C1DA9D
MIEKNKEAAITYLKALVDGDTALMDSVLTDDFANIDRNTAKIGGWRSRDEVLAFAAAVPGLFQERLRFEYESVTAEEDRVVCQVKGFSKLVDGREYNNQYVYIFYMRDGKIRHMDGYYDSKLADSLVFETMDEQNVPAAAGSDSGPAA